MTYTVQAPTALNTYLQQSLAWPQIGQVLRLQRRRCHQNTGQVTETI